MYLCILFPFLPARALASPQTASEAPASPVYRAYDQLTSYLFHVFSFLLHKQTHIILSNTFLLCQHIHICREMQYV